MFLQEAPADTFGYMALGFGVIFGTIGLFILSLIVRVRNRNQELELMDQIHRESES
jgi:hypothetical protein